MTKGKRLGTYAKSSVASESDRAFVPSPLPPEPPIEPVSRADLLAQAAKASGRLDGVADTLPDSSLFRRYYIRKEAVLSSQIEGTQSSLCDLFLYESNEAPSVPVDDVAEVYCYVTGVEQGLRRIQSGFRLSLRLIREMHKILLPKGRRSHKQPGEFRTSQNWIGVSCPGNAGLVPPPPDRLAECLDDFEKYMRREERTDSSLIDAGLIRGQFETIHPFLDGNGRIGRLLITIFLIVMGSMRKPWLDLRLFFKNNREEYYERLNAVLQKGDWEGWLDLFLQGLAETADRVVLTSQKISEDAGEQEAEAAHWNRLTAGRGSLLLRLQTDCGPLIGPSL